MSGGEIYYQKSRQPRFSGVYLVFEEFQVREFKEMLAVAYLVLQACTSFLRCFRPKWRTSVLPFSHKNAVARMILRSRRPFIGVPRGPGWKCPKECFRSAFRHQARLWDPQNRFLLRDEELQNIHPTSPQTCLLYGAKFFTPPPPHPLKIPF